MSNRTAPHAKNVHGTDPQMLIEKIIRERIYDSLYWKEECFGLTDSTILEKAVKLQYVGAVYGGNQRASPFICLALKLLQIQPDKDVILELIKNEDFKYFCPKFRYLRVLAAFYWRLIAPSLEVFQVLEPLLSDKRKIRQRLSSTPSFISDGSFVLTFVDAIVDQLLTQDRVFEVILPRLPKRNLLEETQGLAPRSSLLDSLLYEPNQMENEGAEKVSNESSLPADYAEPDGRSAGLFKRKPLISSADGSSKSKESLSIEATNELRAKLGLKPLKV